MVGALLPGTPLWGFCLVFKDEGLLQGIAPDINCLTHFI